MNFGVGSAFSKGLAFDFSEGLGPGSGPLYKVYRLPFFYQFVLKVLIVSDTWSFLIVIQHVSFPLSGFTLFLFLGFLWRCNLVKTRIHGFSLKVQNCKVLPVFCCDDISKINHFYFCALHSMSSRSTFLRWLYHPWTRVYSFVTVPTL